MMMASRCHAAVLPCGFPARKPIQSAGLGSTRLRSSHRALATGAVAGKGLDDRLLSGVQFHNPAFTSVETEGQFFAVLQAEVAAGRCPKQLLPLWQDFYNNYRAAISSSALHDREEKLIAQVQGTIADCALHQFRDPYTFPPYHQRLLEPYNYYEFGQRYVATLIDFANSVLGHPARWDRVSQLIEAGENVILLANHQTEADPGVFAHMLTSSHPRLATDVIFVAGDRVVTDALCKPFSMGRNLFCVHSKKHINDQPELAAAKAEMNQKTVLAMSRRLKQGGALIWIAPSGGRDRPKADGKWSPDPFDPDAVGLMCSLAARSQTPTHVIPMAMYCYKLMPPPPALEKSVGERRMTNWAPVGISLCEELGLGSGAQAAAMADTAHKAVSEEYRKLEEAVKEPSCRGTDFVQPWLL